MEGPLTVVLGLGHTAELVLGLVTGIGFGFVLERAGFGRADNIAALFYGRDFRVLRVMFSAVVTCVLGLYFLDLAGVLPLHSIGLLETYVAPQIAGGVLLGAGMVIGGYCPGTSLVAGATGRLDGLSFLGGLFAGITAFTLVYDGGLVAWHRSTAMGRVLLHEYFGIPAGPVVLGVVAMAVGAFVFAGKVEAWVNAGRRDA